LTVLQRQHTQRQEQLGQDISADVVARLSDDQRSKLQQMKEHAMQVRVSPSTSDADVSGTANDASFSSRRQQ